MIRLPEKYETEIIEYARLLDSEAQPDTPELRDQVQTEINHVLMSLKPSDRAAAKKLFKKLLDRFPEPELEPEPELAGHQKDLTRIQPSLPLIDAPTHPSDALGSIPRRRQKKAGDKPATPKS